MKKIYICDCDHSNIDQEKAVFESAGVEYRWLHCKSQEEVIAQCQGVDALLNQYVLMDKKIFESIPSLKCVVRYGVGYDNINIEDATRYGVQVCNIPDYGVNEVADHALALMLALVRKVDKIVAQTRKGVWDYKQTIPIHRGSYRTVGIIGVGRIGSAFAKRVKALGYTVIGYDPRYEVESNQFPDDIGYVSLEEVLEKSDIVSVHCSLNELSNNLLNESTIGKMKKGAYLINVSRGGIVDEKALLEAIRSHHLAGAALDVVESEPLIAGDPILDCEDIIVTPHMAWYSEESAKELKQKCAEEALRYVQGLPVRYPINDVAIAQGK